MSDQDKFQTDAARLDAHEDYRVLRRIPPSTNWQMTASADQSRRGLFVDVETTGLDTETDEIIEVALLPFDYNPSTGDVIAIHEDQALDDLRDPGIPIPPASSQVHGITDDDVKGKVVEEARLNAFVAEADLIIAHNAAFDRPMLERIWPCFVDKPWGCSLADIDWRAEGFGAGKLDYLLMQQGWFYDGHRALSDCLAGLFLLSLGLPVSGTRGMSVLLDSARKQRFAIRAVGAPFDFKDDLRKRGYRWDPGNAEREKAWWIIVEDEDIELLWLKENVFGHDVRLPQKAVTALERFSSRVLVVE
ncbi:MAG: 3'-5' exonuclease [Anderseniella sp.]